MLVEQIPRGALDRCCAEVLRTVLQLTVKPVFSPRWSVQFQRRWLHGLTRLAWLPRGVRMQAAVLNGVAGEWWLPSAVPPDAAVGMVLYLHGGAYCMGSPATHRALTSRLARATGLPVFVPMYALAPEAPFPAGLNDAMAVHEALSAHGPVLLAGDSAGGGLALATALALRDTGRIMPVGVALMSPWVDLVMPDVPPPEPPGEAMLNVPWAAVCAQHYVAGGLRPLALADVGQARTPHGRVADSATPPLPSPAHHPWVSPLRADFSRLPPLLIQAGTDELLHSQALALHQALEAQGCAVHGDITHHRWHVFQLHTGLLPSADAAVARMATWMRHCLPARNRAANTPASNPLHIGGAPAARQRPWRRWAARGLAGLAGMAVLGVGALAWMLNHPPSLQPWQGLQWPYAASLPGAPGGVTPPGEAGPRPVRVSFLGVANVLIDDGETAVLTDGFFSRPDRMTTLLGKVEPDLAAITRGLERAGIPARTGRLAVVIPVHSHYDHAMDAPEVVRRTGALLLGSGSTAHIGRGWGLPESHIQVATLGQPMRFGRFTVTLYPSRHAPTGFTGGEVLVPLKPPVRASAYKEGQSYAVHIAHEGRTLLINGSAGFEPGALHGVRADVVMQGLGSLGNQTDAYRQDLWRDVVTATGARRVIGIHWDDLWAPADQPMRPMTRPIDRFDVTMKHLRAQGVHTGVDVRLPLAWQPMDVWAGL
jgi:acetyl esterase/lipase/L-ascorbate metabolism protein UlaG (beta-lactamase superfamily)